jgi:hypothetical protein
VPVGLGNVQTSWAFVGGSLFDPVHVSTGRQEIVCEFDDEHLGAARFSSSVARAFPGTSQLMDQNLLRDQSFLDMM